MTLAACAGTGHGATSTASARQMTVPAGVGVVAVRTTPEHGTGQSPTFQSEPVTGVARYQVFVRNAHGFALWAWEGTETSVRLGADLPGRHRERHGIAAGAIAMQPLRELHPAPATGATAGRQPGSVEGIHPMPAGTAVR